MQVNDKDAGFYMVPVGGGSASGVAAGTGDNTEAVGAIVDQLAHDGLRSGAIVVFGSAVLAEDKTLALNDLKIEHGDESDLSDAVDYEYFSAPADNAAVATGASGGSTEGIAFKQRVNLQGIKRYWRVSVTPDLDASGTDTFVLGFGVVAIGEQAPAS
jgi:hypothetical protein